MLGRLEATQALRPAASSVWFEPNEQRRTLVRSLRICRARHDPFPKNVCLCRDHRLSRDGGNNLGRKHGIGAVSCQLASGEKSTLNSEDLRHFENFIEIIITQIGQRASDVQNPDESGKLVLHSVNNQVNEQIWVGEKRIFCRRNSTTRGPTKRRSNSSWPIRDQAFDGFRLRRPIDLGTLYLMKSRSICGFASSVRPRNFSLTRATENPVIHKASQTAA
jgi:hypothetical protein